MIKTITTELTIFLKTLWQATWSLVVVLSAFAIIQHIITFGPWAVFAFLIAIYAIYRFFVYPTIYQNK